ncbi:thiamine pyrophosphate-binding protein [Blautia sp. JLR.GB0024]|uniref:thiamine pyrophosphate-binding protein n=1 Tax=Blautia sp. JLR.GB0024 TaxID=3123295 RepID=UPI0030059A16
MAYANIDNIKILIQLLKKNKISDLVISPGGTNIPIIEVVEKDDFFTCHSVVDERSAAYYAIGLFLQNRNPVALVCTSAQATRNYVPGLTESFYKRVPILAITMEKHPRFKYQEYMQEPDQTSLPNDCVKKSFELPFITDINDYYHSIRVVNQAILELSKNGNGPVQLCIPWLDFPLHDVAKSITPIKRYSCSEIIGDDLAGKKILIVIGEHLPLTKEECACIDKFCECTNVVIYANHLSNFDNKYVIHGNLLLSSSSTEEMRSLQPDVLISTGGQTGDYPFYLAFSNNMLDSMEHWRICHDGEVVDTYDKLTRIYQGEEIDFFSRVNSGKVTHSYFEQWKELVLTKNTDINVPFSNVAIAQKLHSRIPRNSILQFSILNCLRVWNLFELDKSIECYSNVGAFGIDGGMSTLIGQSVASEKMAFMIIGDLAFLYDMNCLALRQIRNNVRVLLINNNGGIEFKLHGENVSERNQFVAAANHFKTAEGWAQSCGFKYITARNMTEFEENINTFIGKSENPIVFEVFVSDKDESEAYLSLIENNKTKTITSNVKSGIKNSIKGVLGDKTFDKLKHAMKG